MSSVHCVVVWEWQCDGQWLPHTPGVTRTLERAHDKKLTRVVLADADPALKGHYVNLRTLTQCFDTPEGGTVSCGVRRSVYDVQSPGGRGLRWEWAALTAPLRYEPMPMELQCLVEAAWLAGAECVWLGWRVDPARRAARLPAAGPRADRLLRRAPGPPYPRVHAVEAPKPRIPQQRTGPPAPPLPPPPLHPQHHPHPHTLPHPHPQPLPHTLPHPQPQPPPGRGGARSASPPLARKTNLARQILHNLNIFSSINIKPSCEATQETGSSGEQEGRSGRRHSVDTVSTYLSHESKDSLQRGSVNELLNCSAGSDDVFGAPPGSSGGSSEDDDEDLEPMTGAEAECWGGQGRSGVQWGAVCPCCVARIRRGSCPPPRPPQERSPAPASVSCVACGQPYTARDAAGDAAGDAGGEPVGDGEGRGEGAEAGESRARGGQPRGSVAWARQPPAIPAFPHTSTILVTYRFQAGVQSAGHPRPGAPYYAVGFPRHSLLPDTDLGRQVLSALVGAWERGALFGVAASRTTGREHVVAWRAPPPPAAAAHYPAEPPAAAHLLRRLLRRLQRCPADTAP